jgi:hypothetical protein
MTTAMANIPVWIPVQYRSTLIKGYFTNNCVLDLFGYGDNPDVAISGTAIRWGGETEGTNNSAATAEGAAALATNINSAIPLFIPLVAFESNPGGTYEATDFSARDVDPFERDIARGAEWLKQTVNATLLASWVAAINAANPNYAGQARAGFPRLLVPGADNAAVAISIPALRAGLDFLMTAPRRVEYSSLGVFCNHAMASRIAAITNQPIDTARTLTRVQGAPADGGYGMTMPDAYMTGLSIENIPVFSVPGFAANTIAIGPRTGPMRPYVPEPTEVLRAKAGDPNAVVMDGIRMVKKDPANRQEFIQMDTYSELIVPRPGDWFLLTNKT